MKNTPQPSPTAQLYEDIDDRLIRLAQLRKDPTKRYEEELAWAEHQRDELLADMGIKREGEG